MHSMIKSALAAVALTLVAAAPALAQEAEEGVHFYAGVGAGATFNKGNGVQFSDTQVLGAVQAKVGVQFNPYVAVEADYIHGIGGNPRLGNTYVGYVVGSLPIGKFDVLGRVGYGSLSITAGVGSSGSVSVSQSLYSYSVGGRYHITGKDAVRLDVTGFQDLDYAGVALSYQRSF